MWEEVRRGSIDRCGKMRGRCGKVCLGVGSAGKHGEVSLRCRKKCGKCAGMGVRSVGRGGGVTRCRDRSRP